MRYLWKKRGENDLFWWAVATLRALAFNEILVFLFFFNSLLH